MTRVGETRRLPVTAEVGDNVSWDYADAYEVSAEPSDTRSVEEWARVALGDALARLRPAVLWIHRHVLRFRLGPASDADHILGWRIEENAPDVIRLTADGPLMRGVLIGRRTAPDRTELRTFLAYKKRGANLVWHLIGPIHRAVAPHLLRAAARSR